MSGRAEADARPSPEFEGDFSAAERDYLSAHFGPCRLTLLARSSRDSSLTVLTWEAAPAARGGRGPSPLVNAPSRAIYVLHCGERPQLVPARSAADLEREFGEPVPAAQFPAASTMWEGARRALGGLLPWRPPRL